MNILAVNTANFYCSVAIILNDVVIDDCVIEEKNKQAELLFLVIENLLARNNISYTDFDSFVVTLGPGSFVGIRIGIAALQGVSLVANKPLYGISSLEVIAFMLSKHNLEQRDICSVLDAGRGYVYCQNFSKDLDVLTEPNIIKLCELDRRENFLINELGRIPSARDAGLLACNKIEKQCIGIEVEPIYIR